MKHGKWLLAAALVLAAGTANAQEKKINLKLSYWVPPSHLLTPGYKEWADELSKLSNGTITVTMFPSSQLGSGPDHYDMAKRGVADFVLVNPGYTPGRFPVIGVADLPFMSTDSLKAAPAMAKWYKKYAAKEMPDHYVCHVYSHDPGTFHGKKEIKVPADVKGLNVRTANQTIAQFTTSMGGNSIQVPIMESFETLKRGLADAITVPWDGLTHPAFKFGQVTEYTLDIPLYVSNFTHGISKQTYDSMSDNQKKAIDQVCSPEWSAKVYRHWYKDQVDRTAEVRKSDRKITKVGPAEVALWRKAAEPVVATWKESVTKAGHNADEVLNEFKEALKSADALF
jgi:TRAP-type C4-dicarboxylate transport system substrate-binding protein